jgi:maltose O-acetyltransferase
MLSLRYYIYRVIDHFFPPEPSRNWLDVLKERGFKVGENFNMQEGVIIDPSHCWHITIGDNVTLAPRVHILAHDASTKNHLGYTKIGKINIGNRVFIGASSIILPGVSIGNNVIIGAGSVVSRSIPDNAVAAGNPAKIIGSINEFIDRKKAEMLIYPVFGEEFTISNGVTMEMKNKMNTQMKDRYGYII